MPVHNRLAAARDCDKPFMPGAKRWREHPFLFEEPVATNLANFRDQDIHASPPPSIVAKEILPAGALLSPQRVNQNVPTRGVATSQSHNASTETA
jgi:hypothetical protein